MRTHRTILAALGLSVAGLAAQTTAAYAAPSEPSLVNVSSSVVRQTSATLNATIDTGGAETSYRFEYGTSTAYGTSIPVADASIGPEGPVVVGQELTGLQPETTYHYRVTASNTAGHLTSSDETFTTLPLQPPIVSTGGALAVGQTTATLTGTIDTQGYETVYEFDIGADTSYGTRIFGDAGREPGEQTFTIPLQALTPGATYHYRIVATNAFGTTYGADATLTTTVYPTSLLSTPLSPAVVPTALLAPAGTTTASTAKAASVKAGAHAARSDARATRSAKTRGRNGAKTRGRNGREKTGRHTSKGRSARTRDARGANRRSK
jgi:phosphodiesterase/alkaline phosphatase D-like protein